LTEKTRGTVRGRFLGVRGVTEWSDPVAAQLPIRPAAPMPPSDVAASAALESIIISWTAPTKRADGEALKEGSLLEYRVYYSSVSGIDPSNDTTYDGFTKIKAGDYHYNTGGTNRGPWYFVVTAIDTDGQESAASSEVSATASGSTTASVYDLTGASGNVSQVLIGRGVLFVEAMPPASDWYLWDAYKFYYDASGATGNWSGSWTEMGKDRVGMLHNGLATGSAYKYKVSVLDEDGNETTGTVADNGGVGYKPNAASQSSLDSDVISAQYMMVEYAMYAKEFIGGAFRTEDWSTTGGAKIDLDNETIKFGGSDNPVFSYEAGVLLISGGTIIASVLQSNDWSTGAGTQLSLASGTLTMGGASSPGFYATSGGVVQIGPNGAYLDFDPTIPQMVLSATFKTASSGKRIEIPGTSGADADELYAYDSANKKRATVRDAGIEVWNASGADAANRLAYFPSVAASGAWLKHDEVYVTQDLVVGAETDPGGSWDAWVSGPARLGGGSLVTGTLRVGDHDPTGATGYVVNVVFGTGAAPTASNYPEGTLFVKYSA